MHGYIANTDYDWFTFLRAQSPLEEVNFWQPSAEQEFRAVPPGAPFFFKLKGQRQVIAGFGWFARFVKSPAWYAWDAFGVLNGAPDFPAMLRRIEKYRPRHRRDPHGQYTIGCLMISEPVFFDEADWIPAPGDWAINIVRGKRYDLAAGEGARILNACLDIARRRVHPKSDLEEVHFTAEGAGRYGKAQLVMPRLGQGTFRMAVTDAYGRACAVTGEHSLPALDAAHIRPYKDGGVHDLANGLLLRTDIHRLFDKGYVTVTPEFKFEVGRRLKEDYENGRSYYPLHGRRIHLPGEISERPDNGLLEWHNNEVFLG